MQFTQRTFILFRGFDTHLPSHLIRALEVVIFHSTLWSYMSLCHTITNWSLVRECHSAIPWQRAVPSLLLSAGSVWKPQHRTIPISPPSEEGGGKALASPQSVPARRARPGWDHAATVMCPAWLPPLCSVHLFLAASAAVQRCSEGLFRKRE